MLNRIKRYLKNTGEDTDEFTTDIIDACETVLDLAEDKLEEPLKAQWLGHSNLDFIGFEISAMESIFKTLTENSTSYNRFQAIVEAMLDIIPIEWWELALDSAKRRHALADMELGEIDEHPF